MKQKVKKNDYKKYNIQKSAKDSDALKEKITELLEYENSKINRRMNIKEAWNINFLCSSEV